MVRLYLNMWRFPLLLFFFDRSEASLEAHFAPGSGERMFESE